MDTPDRQAAIDAEIAGEIRDRLAAWLHDIGRTTLANSLEATEPRVHFGRVTFHCKSLTRYRILDASRVLLADGLCSVCDYLVPLTIEAPVPEDT